MGAEQGSIGDVTQIDGTRRRVSLGSGEGFDRVIFGGVTGVIASIECQEFGIFVHKTVFTACGQKKNVGRPMVIQINVFE
jgi:hypothetical protein